MKQRTIENDHQLNQAAQDLMKLRGHLPVVLSVTEGKQIRTNGQNARHWAELTEFLRQIDQAVDEVAEFTGYTPLEVRKLIAQELPIEQSAMLFVRKPEAAHDILKAICNIPTSTRLGTKAFSKFDEILAQTMGDILGAVLAFADEAAPDADQTNTLP